MLVVALIEHKTLLMVVFAPSNILDSIWVFEQRVGRRYFSMAFKIEEARAVGFCAVSRL
jgi:hypothetical protein